ncbi:hypothetical protein DFH08DRAFT_900792 [Mycena albidolilacea]|uniref:Zn(2)-C6 fungal-type domain-containing protein n=1 Tax=Mycena albidolilacea TaxID=1033008 RepID=A0AAD7EAI7_9AGAR|nr:hypothetical protein DFH08DRAFT_900792 [Mycena albidolilacea]
MSTPRVRQKRRPKPPACDICKARRVLCHPQPDGKPCPRCVEKGNICTTTPVIRGRPRKNVESAAPETPTSLAQEFAISQQLVQNASASSSMILLSPQLHEDIPDCPDLTPELVDHFFECFAQMPPVTNPLIVATSIRTAIREISFRLSLLPPQSRVLALCIIAFSSLVSFHEVVLGPGPLPDSVADPLFFNSGSGTTLRSCGARRAPVCRALHAAALKAAWEAGVMLQVTTENAASCYMLEMLEQSNFSGLSRPWASAYLSHVRALAPIWRASTTTSTPLDRTHWAGFLMAEALMSTRSRKPVLITHEDQLLLCGPEPVSPEEFLASLEAEASSNKPNAELVFQAMKPYLFYIVRLARQLWATIAGDHLPPGPPSESATLQFLSSLSIIHTILSHLLTRADAVLAALAATTSPSDAITPLVIDNSASDASIVRGCAYGIITGFAGLALPLYRELQQRVGVDSGDRNDLAAYARNERMRLLVAQAHRLAGLGVCELARAIRYLEAVHFIPVQRRTLCNYAGFALDEAEAAAVVEPECVRDIKTISDQLQISGYSQDLFSDPETASLVERLDRYLEAVNAPPVNVQFGPDDLGPVGALDPDTSRMLEDLLLPFDQASATWMDPLSTEVLGR